MEPRPLRLFRNLGRVRQIVAVLLNHGFDDLVGRLKLRGYVQFGRRFLLRRKDPLPLLSRGERIRQSLESLGPTFVKFGQVLSTRPDLVPDDVIAELKQLRENVPPFPGEVAIETLTRELGPLKEHFREVSPEPMAAGSLAQVHRAVHPDGQLLAVKILRPDIRDEIHADIALLHEFAAMLEKYVPEARVFDPIGLVKHFERIVNRELNLQREAKTLGEFDRLFKDDATLHVPRVYPELSSQSVVTMEFIDGLRIDDVDELRSYGIDSKALASNGARVFLKQAFEFGVFHGDPHPGNLRVLRDGSLCLLDYGMVGLLDQRARDLLIDLLLAIARHNVGAAVQLIQEIGRPTREIDLPLLKADVRDFIDSYYGVELGHFDIGHLMSDFVHTMMAHGITCPGDLMLLIRALVTLDGVGRDLDPDFNLAEVLQPFVESAVRQRYDPRRLAGRLFDELRILGSVACQLPVSLEKTLDKLSSNDLRVQLEHRRLDRLINELDRSGNRIVIGMILSSLIVASALIYNSSHTAGADTFWLSVPVFLVSSMLAIWLIYGVFRSGRL